jgi:hypothetical protein
LPGEDEPTAQTLDGENEVTDPRLSLAELFGLAMIFGDPPPGICTSACPYRQHPVSGWIAKRQAVISSRLAGHQLALDLRISPQIQPAG